MSRFADPSRRILLVLVVALLVVLTTATAVLATVTAKNGGAVTAVRTKTSDVPAATSLTSWSDVPGMSTFVTVPSGQLALAIVTFSAESECLTSPTVFCAVRVLLDGSPASPGQVKFDTGADGNSILATEANSMQWVAGPMGAGQHLIRVQYKVDEANSTFDLAFRTLTVLQSKV